jgi:phosphate transport system permease protein
LLGVKLLVGWRWFSPITLRPVSVGVPTRKPSRRGGDAILGTLSAGSALITVSTLGLIGIFLVLDAWRPIWNTGWKFFTNFEWSNVTDETDLSPFGVGALLPGTIYLAVIALLVAVPLSVATALFLEHYAPRRLRTSLISAIDLLAAVPSIVWGLWGLEYLQPLLESPSRGLARNLSFLPFFANDSDTFGNSVLIAGLVLALMITPIITSVSREVIARVPVNLDEAARALGATKWTTLRTVVLRTARPGLLGACLLGLGRALGETIAIALIISPAFKPGWQLLGPGGDSIAALIANNVNEASPYGQRALMAAGLVLFITTAAVGAIARYYAKAVDSR